MHPLTMVKEIKEIKVAMKKKKMMSKKPKVAMKVEVKVEVVMQRC